MDPTLPPDWDDAPLVRPPPGAGRGLQVTLSVHGVPLETRAVSAGVVAEGYPVSARAAPVPGGYQVDGEEGRAMVRPGDRATLREHGVDVAVEIVPQFRLPRLAWGEWDLSLPVLMLASTLLAAQVALLLQLLGAMSGEAGGFAVTPEYIARLLRGETDGAEQGVIAKRGPRPTDGEAIESFYLPPGTAGPITRMGGGKNVGARRRLGDPDASPASSAGGAAGAEGLAPPTYTYTDGDHDGVADADEAEPEGPVAVEVDEGWGFTDWYTTKDAQEDAQEIEQNLRLAQELLRLDPDDPQGLSVRAYYEYLAMDYKAARRTYERYTKLYPDSGAGWNNLALTYKRTKEYAVEENLYRIALDREPEDTTALINLALCVAHQGRTDEALGIMKRVELLNPGDPYADLHRAKIHALAGDEEQSYRYLQQSLATMRQLDTLHNIEFRQDIRIDPAFERMRGEQRFKDLLLRYYGDKPEGWW